jgi:hypothetical protein
MGLLIGINNKFPNDKNQENFLNNKIPPYANWAWRIML